MADCYYVMNFVTPKVVEDITEEFLSRIVHYKHLITISHFAQYDTLKEARAARKQSGGIIVKGIK